MVLGKRETAKGDNGGETIVDLVIKDIQDVIRVYNLQRRTSELIYLPADFDHQISFLFTNLQTKDATKADTTVAFVKEMFKIRSRIIISRILVATSTGEKGDQVVVNIPNCTEKEKELCQQLLSTINKYWELGAATYLKILKKMFLLGSEDIPSSLPGFPPLPKNVFIGVFEERLTP